MRTPEIKMATLYALVRSDYEDQQNRSIKNLKQHIDLHLLAYFPANKSAARITSADVEAYKEHRRNEKASHATINLELAILRRAYNLAIQKGLINARYRPRITMYRVGNRNRRVGFFERKEYERILKFLPDWAQPVLTFGYLTGWRQNEVLGLTWKENYHEAESELRIYHSKNDDGRVLPLADERGALNSIGELILSQRLDGGAASDFIFNRKGSRIRRTTFAKAWARAVVASGVQRHYHDLRRTVSRNLRNAGFDAPARMTYIGHKTVSMDLRYSIVNKEDLQKVVRAISAGVPANNDVKRVSGSTPKATVKVKETPTYPQGEVPEPGLRGTTGKGVDGIKGEYFHTVYAALVYLVTVAIFGKKGA